MTEGVKTAVRIFRLFVQCSVVRPRQSGLGTPRFSMGLPSATSTSAPTLNELGYKGFDMRSEVSLLAPKSTPENTIARLNAELNKSLLSLDIKMRLAGFGTEPEGGTPEHSGTRVCNELGRWGKVLCGAKVVPQLGQG